MPKVSEGCVDPGLVAKVRANRRDQRLRPGSCVWKTKAGSNSQRITPVQVLSINLDRTAVAVDLARAVVELVGEGIEVGLTEAAEVSVLRQVLAQ